MVRVAGTALSRRIAPVHTPFDGDLTFCVSTVEQEESISNPELLALGTAGRATLEAAIEGAVL
jgi:L-aminopeptidase/D-esterase-like protein